MLRGRMAGVQAKPSPVETNVSKGVVMMRFADLYAAGRAVLCLIVVLAAQGILLGQSTTQTVQGLVTDASSSVIPGARVTLTNTGTNVSQFTTTNDTGNYTFALVPVGNYTVKVE